MENLLLEFFRPIFLIFGITVAGIGLVKCIPGPFDAGIFDPNIFQVNRTKIMKKQIPKFIMSIIAIIVFLLTF